MLPSKPGSQTEQDPSIANGPHDLWHCPKCNGPMVVIERLTPTEMQLRSRGKFALASTCNMPVYPGALRVADYPPGGEPSLGL